MKNLLVSVSTAGGLVAASLLGLGTGASAQQGPYGWGPGYAQGGGWHFMNRFAAVDQDQNSVVSAEEAAANVEYVFNVMDGDEDEVLAFEEYMSVRMGPGPGHNLSRQQAMQARKEARFKTMDADGNGEVSKLEFMKAGEVRFAASDLDGDGQVTPWEFRASRTRF